MIVRGDHRVNDVKLTNALKTAFRPARPEEFEQRLRTGSSYIGPTGDHGIPILLDEGVAMRRARTT